MSAGNQAHYFSLNGICILILIHHDILEALGNLLPHLGILLEYLFEVDQKIVIIHQTVFKLEFMVMILQQDNIT